MGQQNKKRKRSNNDWVRFLRLDVAEIVQKKFKLLLYDIILVSIWSTTFYVNYLRIMGLIELTHKDLTNNYVEAFLFRLAVKSIQID